jgi:hypothetical protein
MRNPNYAYYEDPDRGGWLVSTSTPNSEIIWGKTKAAARSRLLRILRRDAKLTATQAKQEEVNDQS